MSNRYKENQMVWQFRRKFYSIEYNFTNHQQSLDIPSRIRMDMPLRIRMDMPLRIRSSQVCNDQSVLIYCSVYIPLTIYILLTIYIPHTIYILLTLIIYPTSTLYIPFTLYIICMISCILLYWYKEHVSRQSAISVRWPISRLMPTLAMCLLPFNEDALVVMIISV